jgi:hypothetical protein
MVWTSHPAITPATRRLFFSSMTMCPLPWISRSPRRSAVTFTLRQVLGGAVVVSRTRAR